MDMQDLARRVERLEQEVDALRLFRHRLRWWITFLMALAMVPGLLALVLKLLTALLD